MKMLDYLSGGYTHGSKYYTAFMGSFIKWIKLIGLNYHYLIFCYLNALFVALTGVVALVLCWLIGLKIERISKFSNLVVAVLCFLIQAND